VPHHDLIATGSGDTTVRIWKTGTLEEVGEPMRHLGRVSKVAVAPDGKHLAAGSWDNGSVFVWDIDTRRVAQQWETPAGVRDLTFDPRGQRVAAACSDFFVRVWDLRSRASLSRMFTGETPFRIAFSGNGKFLAEGGSTGAHLWDAASGESISPRLEPSFPG